MECGLHHKICQRVGILRQKKINSWKRTKSKFTLLKLCKCNKLWYRSTVYTLEFVKEVDYFWKKKTIVEREPISKFRFIGILNWNVSSISKNFRNLFSFLHMNVITTFPHLVTNLYNKYIMKNTIIHHLIKY